MTNDEVRKLLRRWGGIRKEIARLEADYKAVCDDIDALYDLRGKQLDGMPRGGAVSHPTEETAIAVIEEREQNETRLCEIMRKIEEAERFADRMERIILLELTIEEEGLLRARYAEGSGMPVVAKGLRVSVRTAWRMEEKMIEKVKRWIMEKGGDAE